MKIIKIRAIHGPSIFHSQPVLITRIHLAEYNETSSNEISGFNEVLMEKLPGLMKHRCSPGHFGGFHERLLRGTYMAHILEHVALEFSELCGIGVCFGKTIYAGSVGTYDIATRFLNEEGMKACVWAAFDLLRAVLNGEEFEVEARVEQIRDIIEESKMGPSTQAIFDAAVARDIPCRRLGKDSLLRLGHGKKLRHIRASITDRTSNLAVELVQDKALTKKILNRAGIAVPRGVIVSSREEVECMVPCLGFPLVVKPVDGNHGNGVSLNVMSEHEALAAYERAKSISPKVLLEEMCVGRDYRVLVIDGKLAAAAERTPPMITGDGQRTVMELVAQLNRDPRRASGHCGVLSKIEMDEVARQCLAKQNLQLDSVLVQGRTALLRENANLSSGGTAMDITDAVHPGVKIACERIARLVNLDICGIDLIHPDISLSLDGMKVIEVNAGPGLRMHLSPSEGKARNVGERIVEMLYPNAEDAKIPILGVTGTNGKTSTVRMLTKVFGQQGLCVGMTSSDGIYIGGDKIESGDTSGPKSAEKVLSDPAVDVAILELARGGLLRGGLAFDHSDLAIVTNIRADHIGQDGIEDVEDLIRIKSLIVESVREGGAVVLNADDANSLSLATRPELMRVPRNIILYSLDAGNFALRRHVQSGKDACWVEGENILALFNGRKFNLGPYAALPVTLDGLAQFQVSNCLAVTAAALAQGFTAEEIYSALKAFDPATDNLGRLNLFQVQGSYMILDYAHNPDALSAIGEMLEGFDGYQKTLVLGLPGDRKNELLAEVGLQVGRFFDRVILRDDNDLRGRSVGEVPAFLHAILKEKFPEIRSEVILSEEAAIRYAVESATNREIVFFCFEDLVEALASIEKLGAQRVMRIPQWKKETVRTA